MRHDDALLYDMLFFARRVSEGIAGVDIDRFTSDYYFQQGIIRLIGNIGEAASKVTRELQDVHPEIAWAKIIGMRHRIVHGYFDINLATVWESAVNDVPALISALEPLVPWKDNPP